MICAETRDAAVGAPVCNLEQAIFDSRALRVETLLEDRNQTFFDLSVVLLLLLVFSLGFNERSLLGANL